MTVAEAQEEFLVYIDSVRGMSKNTVHAYSRDLELFASLEPIGLQKEILDIQSEDIRMCIGILSVQKKAAASINRFVASVRSLFAYCRKFGYIENNPALEIKSVRLPKRLPRFMTGAEVDELCREPEKNELLWQSRDKAILEVMYSSGCRVSEIASLKVGDLSSEFDSAIVTGKGSKDRRVYFEKDAVLALRSYLSDRNKRFPQILIKNPQNYVFVNQNGFPLSSRGIRFIITTYSGVQGTRHHINPHALRHTFATAMIASGADVRLVQEMLGHSSISTTQRYTHVATDKMIEMYNKAHPHGGKN